MKAKKQTQSTRKHGLSRLEKLLQASIRQELQIKALRRDLCALSAEFSHFKVKPLVSGSISNDPLMTQSQRDWISRNQRALIAAGWRDPASPCDHTYTFTRKSAIENGKCELCGNPASDSSEVWPYRPTFNPPMAMGGGSGLDRNKP